MSQFCSDSSVQATGIVNVNFPTFVVVPFGQELVVAIADFALETVLVFFASNRLSPTTFLSLTNKNTTVQAKHKHN